VLWSNLRR